MANKRFRLVMPALALVFGMALFCACASSAYTVVEDPIRPDNRSAVVYFYDFTSTKAEVWDGEKPVGTFDGTPMTSAGCMPWKTTPGSHTFVARASNNANIKMSLQANRIYYVEVRSIPSPPFTTFVAMRELTAEQENTYRNRYRILEMSYSDEWRQDFLAYQNFKRLKDVQTYLASIK